MILDKGRSNPTAMPGFSFPEHQVAPSAIHKDPGEAFKNAASETQPRQGKVKKGTRGINGFQVPHLAGFGSLLFARARYKNRYPI